ncbi:flavodoxin family protein [Candidatus Woesearchaeota archaeon]|nr:flavodoxin family protein [Candidatus Woesearchaeota archaeon]
MGQYEEQYADKPKIIILNGSPRVGANSQKLAEIARDYLQNERGCYVEQINLREYEIKRCLACGVCGKTKDTGEFIDCKLKGKDDAVGIWEKIADADGLIVSTPVYFGLPTPLLVEFLNRSRYLRHQDFRLTNTVFGVMTVSGRRTGGNETTIFSTWYPLVRNGMIPVGNGDKSCQFGVVAWASKPGEVLEDPWAIVQTKDLADRVYDVASVIKAGSKALNWKNPLTFDYPSGSLKQWKEMMQEESRTSQE